MDIGKLGVLVDVRYTYRQAIEVAYEKAKRLGPVDEELAKECEYIISRPEDPPFDEAELYLPAPVMNIPGFSCGKGPLNSRQFYEKTRLDFIRREEASLVALQKKFKEMQGELDTAHPGLCDKMSGMKLDEQLNITVFAQPDALSVEQKAALDTWFNGERDFRQLMINHHRNMLELLDE